jgi:predicted Ser/Thr protein kinase
MFDLASDGYEIDEQTLSEMGTSENAKRRKSIVDNVGIASVQQRQQQQQQQQQHQHQPSLPLHQGVAVGVAGRSTRTQQGSDESLEIYSSDLSLSGTSPMADGAVTLLSPSLPLHQSDPGDSSSYYSFGPPSSPPLTLARSLSPSSLSPSPYRTIDYRDIKFVSGTPIGRGAFGVVYAAEWRGTKVAVKQLLTFIGAEELAILQVECALLQHCSNHPNVVKFVGACLEGGSFHIVTAFCAGGSVHDAFIVRREPFSNAETLRILRDSACGIMHLHKENVIHRDIAARNFLLDENNNVFVTDFGLARVKTAAYQHTQSSMGPVKYMAPESIALKRYSEQSDAFSFGVYIWEVMHRCEPYRGVEVNFEMMAGIVNGTLRLSIDATITNDFLSDLMQECWCSDPLARPSFTSILERLRN